MCWLVGFIQVASFAQLHFPAFAIPASILADCSRLVPSRVQLLTPRGMRRSLHRMRASDIHASVCLPLLEYCLSDLQLPLPSETSAVWSEFHGLPLLPLEDGSVGVIRVNQRSGFVLGTYNQVQLLASRARMFVSLEARQRLHVYFADARFVAVMGLAHFSIKTLSENVEHVLPTHWKRQDVVAWDPSDANQVDRLWLYRFWQEVRFERRSLMYFSEWPLIPVNGARLVTCGKFDAALCVWREAGDASVREDVARQFQATTETHDARLVDLDRERKELMELSTKNFLSEEVADSISDSEEEEDDGEAQGSDHDDDDDDNDGDDNEVLSERERDERADFESPTADEPLIAASDSDLDEMVIELFGYDTATVEDAVEPADADTRAAPGLGDALVIDMVEDVVDVEYCARETLHDVLTRVNAALIELSFFSGQESDMVPSSRDLAIKVLDCLSTSAWSGIDYSDTSEADATFLAEFFSFHSTHHGGFNRMHQEMLKRVPMFVNICHTASAIDSGEFFLVPSEIDLASIPLPPNARESFLKLNPRLTGFYRDLGVQEMSYAKLLIFLLPMYSHLAPDQCDTILNMIQHKWPTMRGDAELTARLKTTALFRDATGVYQPANTFFDPRNHVLATIYRDEPTQFPAAEFQTTEWLDLMGEIGLVSDITPDVFIGCAQRIEALLSNKRELVAADETLAITLHQYFVQNFERFDRARTFFETISQLAFVPAVRYEAQAAAAGSFSARTVIVKYADCATPDDEALVFTSKPILLNSVAPPRILWSRLSIVSPPAKDAVLAHLFRLTGDATVTATADARPSTMQWQFYLPIVEVFQALFKYLQSVWDALSSAEQQRLADAAIIPVGSSLVKGSRLYFHLGESLAPLMFEVPRAYGAYDTLFRRLGSKDTPTADDYVVLLKDLHAECNGAALNLNELVAVAHVVNLLADMIADGSQSLSTAASSSSVFFLPSTFCVLQPVQLMAYNDAPWLCARINLSALHVVHPRISTRWCQTLGVPGISAVVTEELDTATVESLPLCDTVAHFNAVLATQQFCDGVRKIITVQQQKVTLGEPFGLTPDFDAISRRISALARFEVKCVDALHSRFVATLGHPLQRVDVTRDSVAATSSLSFVDPSVATIFVAHSPLAAHRGLRLSQVVASCINQLLGGVLLECTSVESILSCDVDEIDAVLNAMHVSEDTTLIVEKLRGVVGEPLAETDQAALELAPLSTRFPGELVAVEADGLLRYAKVVQEEKSTTGDAGVSRYEVKVSKSRTIWVPSSQVLSFRTARQGGRSSSHNNSVSASAGDRREAESVAVGHAIEQAARVGGGQLPPSLSAATSQMAPANTTTATATTAVVPATNVVAVVNDLLSRFNVSLSSDYEMLLQETVRLRQRLAQAEEGRRVAAAQIDDAIREKKDVQDSLVCAICLENRVDRVLVPCGHIYCGACVERLPRPSCPICRQHIASSSAFHMPL